jgi:D-alanyl-D-alanine carboxypeptidase/D-alanyl-D-alanine-endopeptidase (penicillin-binding protein 4)
VFTLPALLVRRVGILLATVAAAGALAAFIAPSPPQVNVSTAGEGTEFFVDAGDREPGEEQTGPGVLTEPVRIRTCPVEPPLDQTDQEFFGAVALADTGEVLWGVGEREATIPASVVKLVTAQAALRVLGPDFRFSTRFVEGRTPGEVWWVGGGDPTLSRQAAGAPTYYSNPARLSDLVAQVRAHLDSGDVATPLTTLGVDLSRYEDFPAWNDLWRPNAAALGFVAPVAAVMVDGGRDDPAGRLSPRSGDPVGQATAAVLQLFGEQTGSWGVGQVSGRAPEGGRQIAEVKSAPLSQLVDQMMRDSDNQIAEALIREVALALSVSSFDQAARAGLPLGDSWSDEFFAADGSGLSSANRMSARLAVAVLAEVVTDTEASPIVSSLARPGQPGSLLRRFPADNPVARVLAAKTGSLEGVRSLAGVIEGDSQLLFAVFVVGARVSDDTRDVIDGLVTEFYVCGENLAHWMPTEPGE